MENTAPDYNKHQEALDAARMRDMDRQQVPKKQDNYRQQDAKTRDSNRQQTAKAQDFDRESMNRSGLRSTIKNKAGAAEKFLPHELKEKLDEVRRNYQDVKKLGGEAKTLVKSLTPWGFFSLIGKIHLLTDMPYFFALLAAMLKDGSDLVGIGSLPGIGTAITACDSLFIMAMMFLGNVMHSEHDRTIFQSILLKQIGVLIFTTLFELVFGLDLAPFQTVGVVFIYAFALAARKGRENVVKENA